MLDIQKNGDGAVPVYNVDLDGIADQSTSYVVVTSIADLTDQDPAELEPLWDSVDPDSLDSFVAHASESSTPYQLTFQYQGYTITAENRWLRIIPNEETSPSASA